MNQVPNGRRLWLIRHADATSRSATGRDFDRLLTANGEQDARRLGSQLASGAPRPDGIVSSNAPRAFETARLLREHLPGAPVPLTADERLYDADALEMLEVIRATPAERYALVVVGHNPTITELANVLSGTSPIGALSTACAVELEVSTDWSALRTGCARRVGVVSAQGRDAGSRQPGES
jgi:phosphohistidine phosphatase